MSIRKSISNAVSKVRRAIQMNGIFATLFLSEADRENLARAAEKRARKKSKTKRRSK